MLRAVLGLFGKADQEEQQALLKDCMAKCDAIFEQTVPAQYRDPRNLHLLASSAAHGPLLEMRDQLSVLSSKFFFGQQDLTRAEVAILRQWQRDLTIAAERAARLRYSTKPWTG